MNGPTPDVVDPVEVTWLDSLSAVGRDSWNALAARSGFYLSYDWLLTQEARDDALQRYAVVRRADGGLVAGLPLCHIPEESGPRYHPALVGVPGAQDGPFGLVGSRRGYRSGILLDRTDDQERRAACRALGLALARFSEEHDVPVYALWVPESTVADVMAVDGCASAHRIGTEASLPIGPEGYASALAAMSGRRRRTLRRERKTFAARGYRTAVEALAGLEGSLAPLLAQLEGKYGGGLTESFYADYFTRLSASADPGEVLTLRSAGALVGFCHFYDFGGQLWCRTAGFDYARLDSAFEYFNLAFVEMSEIAVERGAHTVHYGMGSIDAKTNHGASASGMWALTFERPGA